MKAGPNNTQYQTGNLKDLIHIQPVITRALPWKEMELFVMHARASLCE